ncbi:MAG: alpha/beta hydrolase [Gemmatimonadota bacterium]|nr:alpha/beta hydrolase [Gemmatimonadota bacterium]
MTSPHRSRVASRLARLLVAVMLLGPSVAPRLSAQSKLPRFERADCLLNGGWAREVRRECGWLVVPESRDHPSANTARLAVEVFRAKEPTGAPPLVMLHGGPGGPGGIRIYSPFTATSPLVQHRDVVIYDQRGAGFSEPKLCPAYEAVADAARNLRTRAEKEQRWADGRRACIADLKAKGIDPLAYNTLASVADLIDLRRTLGYTSWDVYGESYGARLAQEAMVRDGQAIRSVVLESPVMRGSPYRLEQPLSTQRAFEHVFAACAAQSTCRDAFPSVEQDFYAVYELLTKSPLPVPIEHPDRATDSVWFDGSRLVADIRNRLLNRSRMGLGRLPLLLHELRAGDRMRAAREIVGDGSAGPGDLSHRVLREIVVCYDTYSSAYPKSLDSVNALVRAPFRRVVDRDCEEWLTRFSDASAHTPVRSDIPTLILTGYFDDRTPTEHARRIASTLSRAHLFEFPNEGHGPRPSDCHASILTQFLEDPSRKPDASCIGAIAPISFATKWEPVPGNP